MDAWKKYTILDCVTHSSMAVQQLRGSTLNACWKIIWPECIKNGNSMPQTTTLSSEIIALAHEIGGEVFEDMQTEDIDELLIDKPMDEDNIIVSITDHNTQNNSSDEEKDVENRQLTASIIREGLNFGASMENHF